MTRLVSPVSFLVAGSVLAMIAATACTPQAPEPSASATVSSAAPSPEAAAAKRPALPDCSSLATADGDGPAYKDCRMLDQTSGIAFEARFEKNPTPDEAEHIVNIAVVERGDRTSQTLSEKVEGTIEVMQLKDLDADSFPEVLVPLMTGNVNTEYAVWNRPAGAAQFIRVGTISGFGVGRVGDFVVVNARSAANIQDVMYYTLKNGELKLIGAAEFTAEGDPDKPTIKCAVLDGKPDDPKGGLAVAGLTMKTATAKWCSEDAKKDAF
jgi:hypothetical protein